MQNPNTPVADVVVPSPRRHSPLPERARAPLILLLAIAIPQPWLVALNVRAFYLMSGEMQPSQKQTALALFAFEIVLLAGGAACAWLLHRRRGPVPWLATLGFLLAHAGYLVCATLAITGRHALVPNSVAQWIVQPGTLLFYQFVFVMPATFYSALSLACFPTRRRRFVDIGLSVLVTAGIPLAWYLVMRLTRGLNMPGNFLVTVVIISSVIALAGFMRLITTLYVWADLSGRVGQAVLVILVGLAGPIGGLVLNARIPFPTSFQSPVVYGLAIMNGLLLLFPASDRVWLHRLLWLGRCALLPFTLYFFLVYLPFLPLAIPAMFISGAGFLILVPTALLIIHVRGLVLPLAGELHDGWGKKAIIFAVIAASILPGAIVGGAVFDRVSLSSAIEYVFSPDYRRSDRFSDSRWAVRRALERLRDQKQAVYLPFLTEFYDWAVFDGLTLSTPKMQTLHETFFAEKLKAEEKSSVFGMDFGRRRQMLEPRLRTASFPREVSLTNLTSSTRVEDGGDVTTVRLDLENHGNAPAEYVTTIDLPPGALVSGYWLNVGNERIAGQIFEKKSAIWVYQMIRDVTRRDPGLLVYTSPRTLELRVFPFGSQEQRVTEIEFLSPPGVSAGIRIGDRIVTTESSAPALTIANGELGATVSLPQEAAAQLPQMTREPYLHFIVDRSQGSNLGPAEVASTIRRIAPAFPAAKECLVTAANYEFSDLAAEPRPIDRIAELATGNWLEARGAFLRDRAIKRALLRYDDTFSRANEASPWLRKFPIVVVLQGAARAPITDGDLSYFARLTPDVDHFYTTTKDGTLQPVAFSGREVGVDVATPGPVRVYRKGASLAAAPAHGPAVLHFAAGMSALEVFDPAPRAFQPVANVGAVPEASRYARGWDAWLADAEMITNPSLARAALPAVVRRSRETGVLSPSTAYIVVENSAQWKMLKLKEAQKLRGNKALDFMETPEPSVWLIGALVLVFPAVKRLGRRLRNRSCGERRTRREMS